MHKIFFLILGIAALYPASAQTLPAADARRMDSLFGNVENHQKNMGSGALAKNGKVIYSRAIGYADMNSRKADTETRYRIGSISKMFTSVMIWQLTEEKKLKLNQHLADFFPQIPNAKDITIAQMLNHHSGLHNFTDETYMEWHTQPQSQAVMLERMSKQQPDFAPGTKGEYSNANYVLMGYIIEKATGKSYTENLQQRILNKLGLKHTSAGSHINVAKNEARSYHRSDSSWEEETETDMSIPGGAGSIISTPSDLCRFAYGLFTHQLISESSLKQMTEIKDNYGSGIFSMPFYDKSAYGHTGGIDAFSSSLVYIPADSVSECYISNASTMISTNDMMVGMLSIYYHMPYRIPRFNKGITVANLARFEGIYTSAQVPLKITVKKENNTLTAQATGQSAFPLTAEDEMVFTFEMAGIVMVFKPESDGTVKSFTLKQGGGSFVFTKE